MVHQLIRAFESGGEERCGGAGREARQQSRDRPRTGIPALHDCERKKRAAEALSYNGLVQSWPEITRLARAEAVPAEPAQAALL